MKKFFASLGVKDIISFAAMIAGVGMLIASLIGQANTARRIEALQAQIDLIHSQSGAYYSSLSDQLESSDNDLHSAIAQSYSLIASAAYEGGDLNAASATVPVSLTVVPKEYTDETTASICINGRSYTTEKVGSSYTAKFSLPVVCCDGEYTVTFTDGDGTHRSENLARDFFADLQYDYLNSLIVNDYGCCESEIGADDNGNAAITYHCDCDFSFDCHEGDTVSSMQLVLVAGGKTSVLEKIDPAEYVEYTGDLKFTVPDLSGWALYAELVDSNGFVYRSLIDCNAVVLRDEDIDKYESLYGSLREKTPYTLILDRDGNVLVSEY